MLEEFGLLFYKQFFRKKSFIIRIDDGAGYHTSKTTAEHCRRVGPICLDQPAQPLDFDLIKNLWQIIKIQVSAQHHQIWSLKSMKEVIKQEWEKLTEKIFCVEIEGTHKQCKLVILAWSRSNKYWSIYHVEWSKLYHLCLFQVIIYVDCRVIQLWISQLENFSKVNSLLISKFLHSICTSISFHSSYSLYKQGRNAKQK